VKSGVKHLFTLIELLVVVSIIMLLASLLLPALNKSKETARKSACAGNMKQLGTGILMYANDWNSWLPISPANSGVAVCWDYQIADYVNYKYSGLPRSMYGPPIFHCPSGKTYPTTPLGASRGYVMSEYIALNTHNTARLGVRPESANQAVLLELLRSETGYGGAEEGVFGARMNYETIGIGGSNNANIAFRHTGTMNFWKKDGSLDSTNPGIRGYGSKPIWIYYAPGDYYKYWQDGGCR